MFIFTIMKWNTTVKTRSSKLRILGAYMYKEKNIDINSQPFNGNSDVPCFRVNIMERDNKQFTIIQSIIQTQLSELQYFDLSYYVIYNIFHAKHLYLIQYT